jgi:hypothetical protein
MKQLNDLNIPKVVFWLNLFVAVRLREGSKGRSVRVHHLHEDVEVSELKRPKLAAICQLFPSL